MKDLNEIKASDIKELTIKNLLSQGITQQAYDSYMTHIIECANKGLHYTEITIWDFYIEGESDGYKSYVIKNNLLTILDLKGFNVDYSYGYVNWGN